MNTPTSIKEATRGDNRGIRWIEDSIIGNYGLKDWRSFSQSEQIEIIADFGNNLNGAIAFINKSKTI